MSCACDCSKCGSKIYEIVDKYKNVEGGIIGALHEVQDTFGYISEENQKILSKRLDIPMAEIYGIITFYSRFSTKPKGKYNIQVCMGTACYVKGAEAVLKQFEKNLGICSGDVTEDGKFSIESVRCIGACGLAPAIVINDEVYGKVTPEMADKLVEEYKNK